MGHEHARPELPERPSTDDLFRVLSDPRRRFALGYLDARPTSVTGLTEALTNYEGFDPFEPNGERSRQRIETSLRHVHLPLLADLGLVDWNRRSDAVRLTGTASTMSILSKLDDRQLNDTLFDTLR